MLYLRLGILLAVLAAFGGLGAYAFYQRSEAAQALAERDQARADLATAVSANEAQAKAIDALQEQSRLDGRLVADLVEEMRQINDALESQSAALTELEKANADVAAYLNMPVPSELRRMRQPRTFRSRQNTGRQSSRAVGAHRRLSQARQTRLGHDTRHREYG